MDEKGYQYFILEKLKPSELGDSMANKNGKLEAWFRIKIKLDTAFGILLSSM